MFKFERNIFVAGHENKLNLIRKSGKVLIGGYTPEKSGKIYSFQHHKGGSIKKKSACGFIKQRDHVLSTLTILYCTAAHAHIVEFTLMVMPLHLRLL
jgi:hypothetical protein